MKKHDRVVENYLSKYHSCGNRNAIGSQIKWLLNSLLFAKCVVSILLLWVYLLFSACFAYTRIYSDLLLQGLNALAAAGSYYSLNRWHWEKTVLIKEMYTRLGTWYYLEGYYFKINRYTHTGRSLERGVSHSYLCKLVTASFPAIILYSWPFYAYIQLSSI